MKQEGDGGAAGMEGAAEGVDAGARMYDRLQPNHVIFNNNLNERITNSSWGGGSSDQYINVSQQQQPQFPVQQLLPSCASEGQLAECDWSCPHDGQLGNCSCCGPMIEEISLENKIAQALDLVKNHLMFAVREEIKALSDEIQELVERNEELDFENRFLRSFAKPETLARLDPKFYSTDSR